jgi:acyl-CoA synthetase (AMP-forming)/AMP-acid ligase II
VTDFDSVDQRTLQLGLGELFERATKAWPGNVAAAFPGERLTYRDLWQQALAAGGRLVRAGIRPGEHVGLLLPNSSRLLATLLGASLCGAVPVPLNTRYRTDELPYVIEHADLAGLVTTGDVEINRQGERIDYPARLTAALPGLAVNSGRSSQVPKLRFIAGYGAARHDWLTPWPDTDHPAGAVPSWIRRPAPGDTALLLYTSGTTARPKGVRLAHRALIATASAGMIGRIRMTIADVVWSPAPMCHIGSFVALIGACAIGAQFVSAPYFEPAAAVDLLNRERVTIAYAGFPAFYYDLGRVMRETGQSLPYLKILTTAAGPAEIARVRAALPAALQLSVTGSTELSGSICVSDLSDSADQRANTAGRPLDGIEVSIRDQHGEQVPPGEVGELWVRGYNLLIGYYKDTKPLLTAEPDPGWFRTGDLGTMIEGRFAFRGRLKDMIKVGGENVAAAEIEAYLLTHPAIVVAQVIAAPDERLGEVPAAFVELADGHVLTADQVVEFCRGHIAAYKIPRLVHFVSHWPMSATKIDKPKLRDLLT